MNKCQEAIQGYCKKQADACCRAYSKNGENCSWFSLEKLRIDKTDKPITPPIAELEILNQIKLEKLDLKFLRKILQTQREHTEYEEFVFKIAALINNRILDYDKMYSKIEELYNDNIQPKGQVSVTENELEVLKRKEQSYTEFIEDLKKILNNNANIQ